MPTTSVNVYSDDELRTIPRHTRTIFAGPLEGGGRASSAPPAAPAGSGSDGPSRINPLECKAVPGAAFSAYPTTAHAMACNRFLWHAVQRSSFRSSDAAPLFPGKHVLALCVPDYLHAFLAQVTWRDVEESLFYTLSAAAAGEDGGTQVLERELAASVYKQVAAYKCSGAPPRAFRLLMDLVFDYMHSLGPWTVPVTLAYLPSDAEPSQGCSDGLSSVMRKLCDDFSEYERVLCPTASRAEVLHIMARVIAGKNNSVVWSAVDVLLAAQAGVARSIKQARKASEGGRKALADLPLDVLLDHLVPSVFQMYASDGAPTRKPRAAKAHSLGTPSMENVDEALDLEEEEEAEDSSACHGAAARHRLAAYPCRWSLKFTLLEARAIRRSYYAGIGELMIADNSGGSPDDEGGGDGNDVDTFAPVAESAGTTTGAQLGAA